MENIKSKDSKNWEIPLCDDTSCDPNDVTRTAEPDYFLRIAPKEHPLFPKEMRRDTV